MIISDNKKNYSSKEFAKFTSKKNIKHNFVPTYTPSCNGISERINQIFAKIIRMYKKRGIKVISNRIHQGLNGNYLTSIKGIPRIVVDGDNMFNPYVTKE